MEILADKVIFEHRLKQLETQHAKQLAALEEKNKELELQLEDVWTRFEEVEDKQLQPVYQQQTAKQINNGTINNNNNNNTTNNNINNTINNTININILCDFDKPCLDGLALTPEDLVEASKEKSLLDYNFKRIYFNPKVPCNHVMYIPNKKTRDVVVFKSGFWSLRTGQSSRDTIREALFCVDNFTHQNVSKFAHPEAVFDALPPQAQTVIKEFNKMTTNTPPGTRVEDIFPLEGIYDLILSGREVVRENIIASGCKLIK
jgi:hypothetical protein